MGWIELAKNRVQWRVLVLAMLNICSDTRELVN